jgi:hypothetical protein
MSHFIDVEILGLSEEKREQVWKDSITEEYRYIV